jgi:hypothetical protein
VLDAHDELMAARGELALREHGEAAEVESLPLPA